MARRRTVSLLLVLISALGIGVAVAQAARSHHARLRGRHGRPVPQTHGGGRTRTPIQHLVVIFQENVSFDHYFGTYPHAANPGGEPAFHARRRTPSVNGLRGALLTHNPNGANPMRLDRGQALTCDQNHGYTSEQKAYDMGAMDKFIPFTNVESCSAPDVSKPGLVLDYYDGNTVTGLWNYAQHFAMSDNSYSSTFGPSTPGALNVTTANTFGALCGPSSAVFNSSPCTAAPGASPSTPAGAPQPQGHGTVYSDADPNFDICSQTEDHKTAAQTIQMGGKNIGDLLGQRGVSWGWFQGGFASPGYVSGDPSTDDLSAVCTGKHNNIGGAAQTDYNPHHEPFQYYSSTANPRHLPPTSKAMIGRQDQANHQYDVRDFFAAADSGNLPAVSYLKAPDYEDGHAGYSDPLDEQRWLAQTINHLESLPSWSHTAVVIAYDDSDGWYDHQAGPVIHQSQTPLDALTGTGKCGSDPSRVPSGQQARCGVGPRQPLLVISPYSKPNYVDNTFTDQSSIVRFIEDNWLGKARIGSGSDETMAGRLNNMFSFGRRPKAGKLILDPSTGEPTGTGSSHRRGRGRRR